MNQHTSQTEQPQLGWRLYFGAGIFILGLVIPLFIPLVTATDLPTAWKTVISGIMLVGGPEILSLIAIAILGKPGFNYLKGAFYNFIKRHGPPEAVSRTRYRIGLVMFLTPIFIGWLTPYAFSWIPEFEVSRYFIGLGGDLIFVSSFFVLGGEFWDKVRALFIYDAQVKITTQQTS